MKSKFNKYIVYPTIIILTGYFSMSIYTLTFDVFKWNLQCRYAFALGIVLTILIDIGIELMHHTDD